MTSFQARVATLLAALAMAACGPAPEEALLTLSPDRSSFDGAAERVIVKVRAWEVGGKPAEGLVRLTAPVGHFVGGDAVMLSEGFATATYACSPAVEAACAGSVRLAAEWASLHATTQVSIAPTLTATKVEWEVVSTNSLSSLFAVAAAPDGSAWAVGEHGAVLQLTGRDWRVVPSPVRATLRALAFDEAGAPVIVGDEGVVLRWTSGALQRVVVPFAERESYTAVAVDRHGQLHVGSAAGVLLTFVGDELTPKLDLGMAILAMARQGDEVWATAGGLLARTEGDGWLNLPMPVDARFTVVKSGRESLWLGGERQGASSTAGVIVSGPSPTWRSTSLPEPVQGFTEVPGAPERFALSGQSLYRQFEDSSWDKVKVPALTRAMTSRRRGDLVLVGPPGFALLRTP